MTRLTYITRTTLLLGLCVAVACADDEGTSFTGNPQSTTNNGGDDTGTTADDTGETPDDTADDTADDGTTAADDGIDETATPDDTSSVACGDGEIGEGEACDGSNLDGQDCQSLGFDEGELSCNGVCSEFDTSACVMWSCGNDITEGRELCDGTDVGELTCVTEGFDEGELGCSDRCDALDLSACITWSCGNDIFEGKEVCDGDDLAGEDCLSLNFDGGTLSCEDDCAAFDTSSCTTCGDDLTEGDEVCDGSDLSDMTCLDQGYTDGDLGCDSDCGGYDIGACNTCGNTTTEGLEVCDGEDLDGETCVTLGFDTGNLDCDAECFAFDTSGCCSGLDIGNAVGPGVVTGTNAGGGDDSVGQCDGSAGPDVVYFWTAPDTRTFTIDTLGSDYNTVLYALSDCGGTELACNDQAFSTDQSSVQLSATEGTTYAIVVDGWDGATGDHVLNITPSSASCSQADLGNSIGASVSTGDNAGAGNDFSLTACTLSSGEDVALSWIAPSTGHFQFDTLGSNYDTVVGLYGGCSGPALACDDQGGGGGGQSLLVHPVTAGAAYVIVVDGFNNATGSYNLNITPQLDVCNGGDIGSAVGIGIGSGSTVGAGDDTQPGCTATTGDDLAFQWTAPTTDNYRVDTFGSDFNTVLSVRDGCGGAELVCNNQAGGGDQSQVTFAATEGTTYSIVVDGFAESGNITLSVLPLPTSCVDAAIIDPFANPLVTGSTAAASDDEQTGCTATAGPDVVHQWIAPASGTYSLDTIGSNFDTVIEVRDSCASAIVCNDQANGVGPHSELEFDATAGTSYLFVVDGWNNASGNYTLNLNGPY
ncbi:MAG: hypothetical protein AAF721_10510 [Myxococcota bacterium]